MKKTEKNSKKIIIAVIAVIAVAVLILGGIFYFLHNAVTMKQSEEIVVKGIDILYCQNDAFRANVSEMEKVDLSLEATESQALLPTENRLLYETFLKLMYAGEEYLYTYYDFDDDGIQELCIIKENQSGTKCRIRIMECEEGGLQYNSEEIAYYYIEDLDWQSTAEMVKDAEEEMTHNGIYVYAAAKESVGKEFWYPDEESFIMSAGFADQEPFYEYDNDDGSKRLVLYYDEETEKGCGIRYYERTPDIVVTSGVYGFTFEKAKATERTWEITERDYKKPATVDGYTGENDVSEYRENYEYDSAGRITHYDSRGILTFWSEDETEPRYILAIDYEYGEDGKLRHRMYWHNSMVFGTYCTTWESWFDEQGRIEYEDIYITHGSLDYYYIYADDNRQSDYVLVLDNNCGWWVPEFTVYER